jgi:quercetin dioxygenase-like cupin family protein
MKVEYREIAFKDERGLIIDIVQDQEFEHATLIASKAGARRGDHYHKLSVQTVYVLSGRLQVLAQWPDREVETVELGPGAIVTNEAFERHAMIALEDSLFLVLTKGPRGGDKFEEDTYRLDQPLFVGALL